MSGVPVTTAEWRTVVPSGASTVTRQVVVEVPSVVVIAPGEELGVGREDRLGPREAPRAAAADEDERRRRRGGEPG